MRLPVPPLLVISDRRQAGGSLEELAEAIFGGGCRWLSLREKDLPAAERLALLSAVMALGRRWEATVTVHEDVDAAVMAGARGVHLPSSGNPEAARARLPGGLIGASAHSAAEASALLGSGADYVTISPVFPTVSKPGYGPAIGLDGLEAIAAQVPGPVIALGGINAANAPLCLSAGARGVAVMGEVMRATDPRAVMEAMLAVISRGQ
jgi:thiamine-phosphate pyrophosphorylase